MSLDNADSSLGNGDENTENTEQFAGIEWHMPETFSFEDASSVITTNAEGDNDDSLKIPAYFDMPLLDGTLELTYDESNNNTKFVPFYLINESADQKTALNVENQTDINNFVFQEPLETQSTYDNQSIFDYTINGFPINYMSCHSDDSAVDIRSPVTIDNEVMSEFLVFHEKPSENNDPQLGQQSDPQFEPHFQPGFHPQLNPQLKFGCFVKLNKSEIKSALKERQVALKKKVEHSKRQRTTSVETSLPKKFKCNQRRAKKSPDNSVEHSACSPKRLRSNKIACVDPTSSSECSKLRMKIVRQNNSRYHECIMLSGIPEQRVDDDTKRVETKRCSVVIERLPTTNMWQSKSPKGKSPKADSPKVEYLKAAYPKADYHNAETPKTASFQAASSKTASSKTASSKAPTSKTASSKAPTSKGVSSKAVSSKAVTFKTASSRATVSIASSEAAFSNEESSKGGSPKSVNDVTPSTNTAIGQQIKKTVTSSINVFQIWNTNNKDIKIATSTPNHVVQNYNIDLPLDLTVPKLEYPLNLVVKENQTAFLDCVDQSNEISNRITPVENIYSEETMTIAKPCQVLSSEVETGVNKCIMSTLDNSPSSNDDDDDNCSISSELSIFAPSLSDLDSPKKKSDKPLSNANSESKAKPYRIPKLKIPLENNTKETQQRSAELDGLGTSDELITHILEQMITFPRVLSPIRELDFSISEDPKTSSNIHKKNVPTSKNIRTLRSSTNKETVDDDELNKNSKSNIHIPQNNKRNTRSNTIEGTIDNKSRNSTKNKYEASRELNNGIDAATHSTRNNKRNVRSNTIEGLTEKKTINSTKKIPESRSEWKSGIDATTHSTKNNKRKATSITIEGPTEKKMKKPAEKIPEPSRELKSSQDASTSSTKKEHKTEEKISDSLEKILEPSRQLNDVAGVAVSVEPSEDVFRKETKTSGVKSNTIADKKINIVIKVAGEKVVRNISIAAEPSIQPSQLLPIQPSQLLPNQPNQPLLIQPIVSRHIMPVLPPIQNKVELLRPNQESLDQTIQHLMRSFSPEGCKNVEIRKRYTSQVLTIFSHPCFKYLAKNPCPTTCSYSHLLPHADFILTTLQKFSTNLVQFIYSDFIVKYHLTFEQYFPLICTLYGTRNLDAKLSQLVKDCEKHEKYEYFNFIFDGLNGLCGKNKRDALVIILDRCKKICSESDEAILRIIATDPQSFIQIFSRFPRLTTSLSPQLMSKLMAQVTNKKNPNELIQCVDLLEKNGEKIGDTDKKVLTSFCERVFFDTNDKEICDKIMKMISAAMKIQQ